VTRKVVPLIRSILQERRRDDPAAMSDAELILSLADLIADDPSERPIIAAVLALGLRPAPTVDETADEALELLREAGSLGSEADDLVA
jgi:hypothetical protein